MKQKVENDRKIQLPFPVLVGAIVLLMAVFIVFAIS